MSIRVRAHGFVPGYKHDAHEHAGIPASRSRLAALLHHCPTSLRRPNLLNTPPVHVYARIRASLSAVPLQLADMLEMSLRILELPCDTTHGTLTEPPEPTVNAS